MSMQTSASRVWFQPIRNRQWRPAACELLHREADATVALVTDDALATDEVIQDVFGGGEAAKILGDMTGFVNVDAEMLLSRRVGCLPADRVMLELLETVVVDDLVVSRCRELKGRGYRLALDDFHEFRPELLPLLDLVDVVKVDIALVDEERLDDLVERLRRFPPRLLAEKVATRACALRCQALSFDYFQGYFFDLPMPASGLAH